MKDKKNKILEDFNSNIMAAIQTKINAVPAYYAFLNNPAFKLKILPLKSNLEINTVNTKTKESEEDSKFKINDLVVGYDIKTNTRKMGFITKIDKLKNIVTILNFKDKKFYDIALTSCEPVTKPSSKIFLFTKDLEKYRKKLGIKENKDIKTNLKKLSNFFKQFKLF